jgi:copper transport protein
LALIGLGLVVVANAGPASAHAILESTTPASGEAVATSPKVIELDFSEPVEVSLGAIRLFDTSGRELDVGRSRHPSGDDTRVASTAPELGDGSYVVAWRVVSADSHPVNGAFTFDVATGAAPATPGASSPGW